jgi:hypothetical protein
MVIILFSKIYSQILEKEKFNLEVEPKLNLSCACIKPLSHWKMIQTQLKSNFSQTFLLSFKKETDVEERESLKLEREREI